MLKNSKFLILLFIVLFLSACSASGPDISIEDAWIRPDPLWEQAAGYFVLTNNGGETDTLKSITTEIAKSSMIHQTTMKDGIHRMEMLIKLEVPPGESVEFKPLSYHIMMSGLSEGLEYGQIVTMTFEFEKSGKIIVEAEIREE